MEAGKNDGVLRGTLSVVTAVTLMAAEEENAAAAVACQGAAESPEALLRGPCCVIGSF